MKKIIISILFVQGCQLLQAQTYISGMSDDSSRIVELREVTVSAQQKNQQLHLLNFFRSNNSSTLEDIMSRLPEITLVRRGSYGMEPSIRAFTGGQINVLIDGMRIHGACTDKMDPASIYIEPINLDNLQVNTINNGLMSGSSIGGTINMKMAEPDFLHNKKVSGTISSGYQSAANSFYESARINYSSGNWAFRASGTYRHNSNYRSGGGDIVPFSQYEKVNYSMSAKFQKNASTYLKADLLADDAWNIGYPALPMDVGYAAARIASISIHHENRFQRLYKWQAKVYANKIRHFMDDTHRPDVQIHMDMPGISKTFGMNWEGEIKMNLKHRILFRVDGTSTFLKASMTMYLAGQLPMYMLTWPDNRKGQWGLSASWLFEVDSSIKLQLTGRTDYVNYHLVSQDAKDQMSIFGYTAAGRNDLLKNVSVQLSKKIKSRFKTTTGFSYSERIPTASELYGFYLFNSNDGYDYTGNPGLKKEQSFQIEASALYTWKRNRLQFTCYYSRISNFITGIIEPSISSMTIGAKGVKSFINTAHATIKGLETSAFIKPSAYVDIVSTLRLSSGTDNSNSPLPSIAPLKNITSVSYQPKRFLFQLETEVAGKQNRVNTKTGEDKTRGYILLHTRAGYSTKLFKKNISIQSGVENIFDRKYHEHLDWGNIERPGRNLYMQVKVQF